MHTANRYDPIRPPFHAFYLARALAWTGRFEEALPLARSCMDRTPGFWPCAAVLIVALAHLGRIAEAASVVSQWQEACGDIAPLAYMQGHDAQPGVEMNRMREGFRLAGLAEG